MMDYQERLVCFIDLLGFQSAIDQSLHDGKVIEALYRVIHTLKEHTLKKGIYGTIPVFLAHPDKPFQLASDVYGENIIDELSELFPLDITQFSDSLVISCPSSDSGSCLLLLKCIYFIKIMVFYNLGMMLRGGIALGKLIHEEGGALFGPAMNEAYYIESKLANYPRVLISENAYDHLIKSNEDHPLLKPIFSSNDDYKVFDLISVFECSEIKIKFELEQLKAIEQDILENSEKAYPKIKYLLDRWEQKQKEVDSQVLQ